MRNETKADNFLKEESLRLEKRIFLSSILFYPVLYLLITLWLNSIRETSSLFFVWILIIIQFIFYFKIFIVSYKRSNVLGFNKNITPYVFIILAFLARVDEWELIIIPVLVIVMATLSSREKVIQNKQ